MADSGERNAVTKLADLFSRGGTSTVATLLKKVAGDVRPFHADAPVASLAISQLKRTLAQAEKFLGTAGAKSAAADLQTLISALPTTSGASLPDWLGTFEAQLLAPAKRAARAKGLAPSATEQIEAYVKSFNEAGYDKDAFLIVHASLSNDSAVKAPEAKEIVQRVTKLAKKHASKKKAVEFLLEDFYGRLRQHNELANVSKARPW
jgi:hypothetical protein